MDSAKAIAESPSDTPIDIQAIDIQTRTTNNTIWRIQMRRDLSPGKPYQLTMPPAAQCTITPRNMCGFAHTEPLHELWNESDCRELQVHISNCYVIEFALQFISLAAECSTQAHVEQACRRSEAVNDGKDIPLLNGTSFFFYILLHYVN